MIELALFGLGVVLIAATWSYMWRPAVLDTTRDKLFDLRDETVRAYFVERKLGLDHPSHLALRELLNGHLRHTESLNFLGFVLYMASCKSNPEAAFLERTKRAKGFATDDPEIQKLIDETRNRAAMIMMEYMVESSLLVYLIALMLLVIEHVKVHLTSLIRIGSLKDWRLADEEFAQAFLRVWSAAGLAKPERAKRVMENCAYIGR